MTRDRDEGASAVEYGLMLAAIAAVIVIAVVLFGDVVLALFQDSCESVRDKAAPSSAC